MLEVDSLHAVFPTPAGVVKAVNGVTFAVHPGEMVGLVGESGSGKSATVRSIIGLLPDPGKVVEGSIRYLGQELVGASGKELRRVRGKQIGFVGQNPFASLNPILRIEEQFHNVLGAHGPATRADSRALARLRLAAVGIADPDRVLAGHAHELSGGMSQRVVVALAMLHDPSLLIADEPTTALDLTVQRQVLDVIARLLGDGTHSMLLVTHDLTVVAQYCDRVLVMYAGRIVEEGPVREVIGAPKHPYTRALLESVPRSGRPLRGIAGTVPNLIEYPSGCSYQDRCPLVTMRCRSEPPELRPVAIGRQVACHEVPDAAPDR
jgi:peptide/nickel transport system ATP-binding protein